MTEEVLVTSRSATVPKQWKDNIIEMGAQTLG